MITTLWGKNRPIRLKQWSY